MFLYFNLELGLRRILREGILAKGSFINDFTPKRGWRGSKKEFGAIFRHNCNNKGMVGGSKNMGDIIY